MEIVDNDAAQMDSDVPEAEIIQFPMQGTTIARFYAVFKDMKVDRKGQLVLTLAVPADHKYAALPTTDFPGMLMEVEVTRAVLNYSVAIEAEARRLGMDVVDDPFAADDDG